MEGLPDSSCWDGRATPEQIHEWARRVQQDPYDRAAHLLGAIGSPEAADTLRQYLTSDNTRVLQLVVTSLGWSGDATDAAELIRLLEHEHEWVRTAAMESLTDLGITAAGDPLFDRLNDDHLTESERGRVIECLVWMQDHRVAPMLRERFLADGLHSRIGRSHVAPLLARVGGAADRAEMARLAISSLERSAADGYTAPRSVRARDWWTYVDAVSAVAPEEVEAVTAALSEPALLATTYHPWVPPTPDVGTDENTSVARKGRRLAGFVPTSPTDDQRPPGKFFGQPDWRERPTWPIGGDGDPLMFYGQLPLDEAHTAYLFCAGPDEWQPLGPGSALIVQPGGGCHLPTVERHTGPQNYHWVEEPGHFVRRIRHLPRPERFIVWDDETEPDTMDFERVSSPDRNHVGGTPSWLQGDSTPDGGWNFAFQFVADVAGSERGDGAEFYGWTNAAGEGAAGWDCH
jgi:hypothetical protein